jgi:outer membrane protein assembly factor BamB
MTVVLGLLLSFALRADDWPQFRGPNRDSDWNETGILKTFPTEGLKIRWRTPVGPGWSSPVVVRGRVYLTDMRSEKPRAWERIRCFEESTGKPLWSYASELVYPDWAFIPEPGGGPAATPIVEDGKIYSLGRSGQVDCLDAHNGKVIWETSLNPATGETWWREPLVTNNNYAIPTPVVQVNRLLIAGLMLELNAHEPAAPVLWPESRAISKRILSNTSTAMLRGDHVFSAKSNGELVSLEVGTGKQVWGTTNVTELKNGASIHLTPNGDATFLFTDEGNLILARLAPGGYREISRSPLVGPTSILGVRKFAWTSPAYANRHVFARNDEELVCASLAAER